MTKTIEDTGQDNLEQSSLDEELLKIIASQVKSSPYAISLAMGIIAYMIYRHIPDQPLLWGGWISLVLLTQAYRVYRLPKLPLETHIPIRRRTREAALMNVIGIGIQSLSLLAFPLFTPFEASVQTMMFVGMGVGSIVTAVGWSPYTLSHIGLTLIPAYSLWLWSGLYGPSGTVGTLVAIVGYAYALTMWIISKRLYKMHQEFFANRAALAVALEDAEAAGTAKTRFLASASHDLRQPIHALSMSSATLAMGDLNDQSRQISNTISTAVTALSSQLDALLDISKLDAGIVPVQASQVNLRQFIEQLFLELEDVALSRAISFHLQCPEKALAHADSALLKRIVSNILSNTVNHNTECDLYVLVSEKSEHWTVEIRDTGSGIGLPEQQHVFEEFYQVHNPERGRSKGLGLGLSIVKRLSTLLELDMTFDSAPGEGTRFTFKLPIATSSAPVVQTAKYPPNTLQGTKVLVVDDEPAVIESTVILLEVLGCLVNSADNTENALTRAQQMRPDIALVDLRLRGSDRGIDAISRLRKCYPGLPAILISGDTAPDRLQQASKAGIPLLSKPVVKDELCAAIASALASNPAHQSSSDT